ncbi:hypothetical protein NECAME_10565 [Necator americanus]|uniref:Uncharacterized protein n=1 Tax=Necator americanus TaxID=51031 RepID=W2TA83_NECAM|nr:hypothetical protein NECAME_10565 [Necator americanus]ETN78116.1 hypothetical protein NECAME_10565 [Necator americanus]
MVNPFLSQSNLRTSSVLSRNVRGSSTAFCHQLQYPCSLQDNEALVNYCAQPQNREVCEQLLASLILEEQESLPQMDKRKPSFVRFGKRTVAMMEKRKPSFVRFGRK